MTIGPSGVFTLNTKRHAGQNVWVAGGTFMVAGQRQKHVRNSVHEAARAARRLSVAVGEPVPVQGVLVVVDAKRLTVREQPKDVVVVSAGRLHQWLIKRPAVFTPEQILRLLPAANRPSTWHDNPVPPVDAAAVVGGFAQLDAEARGARRVRQAWTAAGAAGAVLTAVLLLDDIARVLVGSLPS